MTAVSEAPVQGAGVDTELELPVVPEPRLAAPLPPETREALGRLSDEWYRRAVAYARRYEDVTGYPLGGEAPQKLDERLLDQAFLALQRAGAPNPNLELNAHALLLRLGPAHVGDPLIRSFLRRPEIQAIHALRFQMLSGSFLSPWREGKGRMFPDWDFDEYFLVWRRSHEEGAEFTLRHLAAHLRVLGLDPSEIGRAYLRLWDADFDWDDQAWQYFVEYPDELDRVLGLVPGSKSISPEQRKRACNLVAAMPAVPQRLVPRLWDMALGTAKTERPWAQRAMDKVPGKEVKIVEALDDGKQNVRLAAAQWLADLPPEEVDEERAIAALEARMAVETQEKVKGALLEALEHLGGDVEQFLDREELQQEAVEGLAKGLSGGIEWLDLDDLPEVRWHDGAEVGAESLRWLVVRGVRLKAVEPGPLLRRYAERFENESCRRLGRALLEGWIEEDIHGEGTSAMSSKGVLSVVGATAGREVVEPIEDFLKRWYGKRQHQCKALLAVLAWVRHPEAEKLLLAVSHRFRTAGIRREAQRLAGELAERRGWSEDELLDRTVPDADLVRHEDGEVSRTFDLGGGRELVAVLDDDLELTLRESGELLASFPDPREGDDPERAKEAKREFRAARKEVTSVVRLQTRRLYEALCVQRSWRAADWRAQLLEHPILGRLCSRVVWVVGPSEGPEARQVFRPTEDGRLLGAEGKKGPALAAEDDRPVRQAHATTLTAEESSAWLAHLERHDIEPPFRQLGTDVYRLPEDLREAHTLDEFQGHLVWAHKLDAKALELGWVRGETTDGRYFRYEKEFPGLSLEGWIRFTGHFAGDADRKVALLDLIFLERVDKDSKRRKPRMVLGEVPPVLLSETRADLAAIAARGTGYDPDWRAAVDLWQPVF